MVSATTACGGKARLAQADSSEPSCNCHGETADVPQMRVLVTNDDGYSAAGIDALAEALWARPDIAVIVVAPSTNESGTGGDTTDGIVNATDALTGSGRPAKAVNGYPADCLKWAVDKQGVSERPDLVISGINLGENVGPSVDTSGTVGAARAAAARKIPALAA
ncbi:MAG TPA: 5'/3'-nucleotidase SurE, partial [Polyangia bacterium]